MNWIELFGFALGIVGVFLTIIEHPACFPAGILSVAASFIVFKEQGLYSNALLQLLFLVLLVYGWWNWLRKRPAGSIRVSSLENGQIWILLTAGISTGLILGWFFSKQPGV